VLPVPGLHDAPGACRATVTRMTWRCRVLVAVSRVAGQRRWRSVLLVTSATHLPRALATFRRLAEVTVIPVACDFQLPDQGQRGQLTAASLIEDLLPDAEDLHNSTVALKEHLGLLIYRLQGWS
jgi:uncharacterized SAM-binding protein YcdF (DUF218 family)